MSLKPEIFWRPSQNKLLYDDLDKQFANFGTVFGNWETKENIKIRSIHVRITINQYNIAMIKVNTHAAEPYCLKYCILVWFY